MATGLVVQKRSRDEFVFGEDLDEVASVLYSMFSKSHFGAVVPCKTLEPPIKKIKQEHQVVTKVFATQQRLSPKRIQSNYIVSLSYIFYSVILPQVCENNKNDVKLLGLLAEAMFPLVGIAAKAFLSIFQDGAVSQALGLINYNQSGRYRVAEWILFNGEYPTFYNNFKYIKRTFDECISRNSPSQCLWVTQNYDKEINDYLCDYRSLDAAILCDSPFIIEWVIKQMTKEMVPVFRALRLSLEKKKISAFKYLVQEFGVTRPPKQLYYGNFLLNHFQYVELCEWAQVEQNQEMRVYFDTFIGKE